MIPPSPTRSSKFSNFRSLLGGRPGSEAVWEAEEKRRVEDQRRALAKLAGVHEGTPVGTPMGREEKVRTGYF